MYVPDPLEIAGGWVHGYDTIPLPVDAAADPRAVLDRMLAEVLSRTPCLVAFSGGRDSSVLLAAAVAVARREGLPPPIPATLSYPDAPDAGEADWQRVVLEHLGLTERIVLTVHGEHDPVGPIAAPLLRGHGQFWPPNIAPTWRMLDQARGGVLLTGEGGDEVFGRKRVTPLTKAIRSRGRVRPRVYGHVATAIAPAAVRGRTAMRQRYRRPWLRPAVADLLARRDADDIVAGSLHAGMHAWQYATRRGVRRGYETVRALASEMDAEYVQVFGELDFVAAVARRAGFWGWTGRTAAMRALFDDLLPRAVLERRSKAVFGRAVFAEHTREFAREWTGGGVDDELVDAEALRAMWLSERPAAPSMPLLQQAWLNQARP